MPELPEVETIKRSLSPLIVGQEIEAVEVFLTKAITPSTSELIMALTGSKITAFRRRGKYLLLELDTGKEVAIHLRMTGQLLYKPGTEEPEKHTTLIIRFADGQSLHFVDSRKFGTVVLYPPSKPPRGLKELGPEPLKDKKELILTRLQEVGSRRRSPIKGLLLDQKVLAGLGNIYADETLFLAKIKPTRPAQEITGEEWKRIYESMIKVLQAAIKNHGTSLRDYVDGQGDAGWHQDSLQVYGRKQKPCLVCGHELIYTRVAGRGTHYCSRCQN